MFDIFGIPIEQCLFYSLIGTTITSTVVIIGWIVNNSHANARQVRTEQLAKKEEINSCLGELENAVRDYYAGPENKRNLAKFEILGKLDRLSQIIDHLIKHHSNEENLYKKFTSMYEAITDGSFGSDTINNEASEEKYKRILLAKNQLCSEIETTFCNILSNNSKSHK